MEIWGKSKAIHGTWFWLPEYNFLLDAGDGVSSTLGIHSSDVNYIFVSHSHLDHISGLLSLGRFQERTLKNDPNRSLVKVLYESGCKSKMLKIKNFLKDFGVDLEFIEFNYGEEIEIKKNIWVKPFPVNHNAKYYREKISASGCQLIEKRKRLPEKLLLEKEKIEKEYTDKKEAEKVFTSFMLDFKKKNGEAAAFENYDRIILSYCGDSEPVDYKLIADSEVLLHEATFLLKGEMEAAHSCLEDVLKVAQKAKVGALVVYHLSERYKRELPNYKDLIKKMAQEASFSKPLYVVGVDDFFRANI